MKIEIGMNVTAYKSQCIGFIIDSSTYTGEVVKVNKKSIIVKLTRVLAKHGDKVVSDTECNVPNVKYTYWKTTEDGRIIYKSDSKIYGIIEFKEETTEEETVEEETVEEETPVMKVTTYVINKGEKSQYFGLKNAEENTVLYSAPNNWKTERGAINWAKKHGFEVVEKVEPETTTEETAETSELDLTEEKTEKLISDYEDFIRQIESLKEENVCPVCGRTYTEAPAISREDNATEICPDCGTKQALEAFLKHSPESPSKKISPALVPDDEFKPMNLKFEVPTVNDILKLVGKAIYKTSIYELLSDIFKCGAIAISNQFDMTQRAKREEEYKRVIKKYDTDTQNLIAEIFANIYVLLTNCINSSIGFNDYLGELYMRSNTSSSQAGQFFTPYHVSKMCAEVTIDEAVVKKAIENDEIITQYEPTCGSGGMVLAAADILYNKYHFNISRNLLVVCGDIDERCVHMTYLQLSLAGIPAVIYHQDALTLETWGVWETPAYLMQWRRFKHLLEK